MLPQRLGLLIPDIVIVRVLVQQNRVMPCCLSSTDSLTIIEARPTIG